MKLTDEDVREILRLIDESDLEELSIETEGFALHVRKGTRADEASRTPQATRGAREASSARVDATAELKAEQADGEPAAPEDGTIAIESPMLGTFYRAPDPGSKPFVEVGTEIQPDTIVCIIEVMKMINSIPAGVAGTIVEVCSENAEVVEPGEPLFRVKAST
jgi:acetyl-CoA carboxylase biotin carboxyl carrier protein